MTDRQTLRHHAGLVDRMATARGIDLEAEALSGAISFDEISEAVLRCTGCSDPGHCDGWLDTRSGVAGDGPGYCRNRDLLDRLAR